MKGLNSFFVLLVSTSLIAATGVTGEEVDDGLVVVTQEQKFDYITWKIQGANGTWHYEIEHAETGEPSTGFSSAIDRKGNDWIGNNCVGMREWRGWPNFGTDGFGHPCRGGNGKSRWLDSDGNPVKFTGKITGEHLILESWNDKYRLWYHFFPTHAAIEVKEAKDLYAFLYEGPPAGEMKVEQQHYVLKDGKKRDIKFNTGLGYIEPEFGRNFPSPYFYFTDEEAENIIYMGLKGQSEGGDEGWCQPGNMVIFSFGREDDKRALHGTEAVSVFGFLSKDLGHKKIDTFIKSRLEKPF